MTDDMRPTTLWALTLILSASSAPSADTERLQIDGEWCFIKSQPSPRPGEAVILIHGNGETVEAD